MPRVRPCGQGRRCFEKGRAGGLVAVLQQFQLASLIEWSGRNPGSPQPTRSRGHRKRCPMSLST